MSNIKVEVKFCNFLLPTSDHLQYMCYGREICCDNGCCVDGPRHFYQTWYYWCLLLIVMGLASASSWLCRKPSPNAILRADPFRQLHSCNNFEHVFANGEYIHNIQSPRNFEERSNDIILNQLYVSFNNTKLSGNDPPSYNSIFKVEEKPSTSVCQGCESPPSYTSTSRETHTTHKTFEEIHQNKDINDSISREE